MKTKKRGKILSLLLALSMLVGMVPLSVIPAMAAGFGDVQVTSSYCLNTNLPTLYALWGGNGGLRIYKPQRNLRRRFPELSETPEGGV